MANKFSLILTILVNVPFFEFFFLNSQNKNIYSHSLIFLTEKSKCDGLVYKDTCIKLLYTVGDPVDYHTASNLCSFHGGKLADIETDAMFYDVYEYVKGAWNVYKSHDWKYVNVWLASKFMVSPLTFF